MQLKPTVLESNEVIHSIVVRDGTFFAVIQSTQQIGGFAKRVIELRQIEEIADVAKPAGS